MEAAMSLDVTELQRIVEKQKEEVRVKCPSYTRTDL